MTPETIDVVVSFDTTGSMYPCLTQVRKNVDTLVKRLFEEVPNIRIGVIAHGDYCDAPPAGPYVTKIFDLSTDKAAICKFVKEVQPTYGGDTPECYELVLHQARSMGWTSGRNKALVVIGDAQPHGPKYAQNTLGLDWRNELGLLLESGIHVYSVQCMDFRASRDEREFYMEMAAKTKGFHLTLDQFASIADVLLAICYKQQSDEALNTFEQEVIKKGRMTRNMGAIFHTMTGHAPAVTFKDAGDLVAVEAGRFQVIAVDEDRDIKSFVQDQGLLFQKGRGFYQFTKTEKVQSQKEVILRDKISGDFYTGEKARQLIGAVRGTTVKLKPAHLATYDVFIQSTSVNRKLIGGTQFLYEAIKSDEAYARGA